MWSDSVSEIDMLSYEPYAQLIYDISTNGRMNPLTIGLLGSWGSGKSTLLNLVNEKIEEATDKKVVSIMVNAWMFEGYDDAKTALMDSILRAIDDNKKVSEECKQGLGRLIKKVDWIRVGSALAKKGLPLALSLATGNPMPTILSSIESIRNIDFTKEEDIEKIGGNISKLKEFLKDDNDADKESIVENIRTFRKEFEDLITDKKSNIDNLIIIIDDLDRCSPERILETLEAVKLFLSVKKTTFIIAMDEDVIRYSVKKKYPQLSQGDEIDVSKDYIEKIVQLPIKLPELSDIDMKNYMLLLICEMYLKKESLVILLQELKSEGLFTKGEIISSVDIKSKLKKANENYKECIEDEYKLEDFENQLDIFSKIGDIVSVTLKGNPRQAKRFLNTFYVRKKLADIQKLNLKLAVLAKLMVLEYVDLNLFKQLYKWQFENGGLAVELKEIENSILNGEKILKVEYNPWEKDVIKRWIFAEPTGLYNYDLRQYFYLARESVKDKNISMLDLGLEERRKINEICKKGLDNTTRSRKVKEIKEYAPNKKDEIIKGIISKFNQDHTEYFEVLINVYEFHEDYRGKIIKAFQSIRKGELTIAFISLLQDIEKINPEQIAELKIFYFDKKITKETLWNKVLNK
ncbi:KAP family P-loop NTPase fold protein [Clostridium sp.]|uniref:KAP family P-loop NTPase fold protein n=1 Tax=Clostridium sp. TaxID=1506 RepID=UPI003D6CABB2